MGRKRARASTPNHGWESLAWREVDTSAFQTGDLQDAMFCTLEEVDGNFLSIANSTSDSIESATLDANKANLEDAAVTSTSLHDHEHVVQPTEIVVRAEEREVKRTRRAKRISLHAIRVLNQTKRNFTLSKADPIDEFTHEDIQDVVEVKEPNTSLDIGGPIDSMPKRSRKNSSDENTALSGRVVSTFTQSEKKRWGSLQYHPIIVDSLLKLSFTSPTPIQRETGPHAMTNRDVIGAAETGSGKTLAYGLPILQSLISSWTQIHASEYRPLFSLILTPTRELSLQVVAHLNAVVKNFPSSHKLNIVCIVGGMAEQKQRRLLSHRPHIICATPGRLWELIKSGTEYLQDLSRLRYLVVDEADRMAEEGSFAELSNILDRIKSDETQAKKVFKTGMGRTQLHNLKLENENKRMYEFADEQIILEEARNATQQQDALSYDAAKVVFDGRTVSINEEDVLPVEFPVQDLTPEILAGLGIESDPTFRSTVTKAASALHWDTNHQLKSPANDAENRDPWLSLPLTKRQTFLFSATLMVTTSTSSLFGRSKKTNKKKVQQSAQDFLRTLMSYVGVRGNPAVIDLTPRRSSSSVNEQEKTPVTPSSSLVEESTTNTNDRRTQSHLLPAGLCISEIRCSSDEKDDYAYYFLTQYPGKTLIFVNAISGARRLLNLLQALKVHARGLHAQLQQRQRLKTIDFFKSSSQAVLVATDVAARGLDVKDVQHVIHFDIPRSTQIYIHRSGRTARAMKQGLAISLVTPREHSQHSAICADLGKASLPVFPVQLNVLPHIHERIRLARLLSRQAAQVGKVSQDDQWLRQMATDAGLELDEATEAESEATKARVSGSGTGSQVLLWKKQLESLLSQPLVPQYQRKFVDVYAVLKQAELEAPTALDVAMQTRTNTR